MSFFQAINPPAIDQEIDYAQTLTRSGQQQGFYAAVHRPKNQSMDFESMNDLTKLSRAKAFSNSPSISPEPLPAAIATATPSPEMRPTKGTNYDPLDPSQNDPGRKKEDIGKGATGILITSDMVAVPRKRAGSNEPMLPYGTVIFVPELNRRFLVADTMNARYTGQNKIDIATPRTGSKIDPRYNRSLTYQVIELGNMIEGKDGDYGHADARKKAIDLSWK